MGIMIQEGERGHSILTHHIVSLPNTPGWAHLRPIFIGSHDLPMFKRKRRELNRLDVANDGLHLNVVALVARPRDPVLPDWFQYRMWGPQSRLKVPLVQHFQDKSKF